MDASGAERAADDVFCQARLAACVRHYAYSVTLSLNTDCAASVNRFGDAGVMYNVNDDDNYDFILFRLVYLFVETYLYGRVCGRCEIPFFRVYSAVHCRQYNVNSDVNHEM